MDGENNGKPGFKMCDLGGKPIILENLHIGNWKIRVIRWSYTKSSLNRSFGLINGWKKLSTSSSGPNSNIYIP